MRPNLRHPIDSLQLCKVHTFLSSTDKTSLLSPLLFTAPPPHPPLPPPPHSHSLLCLGRVQHVVYIKSPPLLSLRSQPSHLFTRTRPRRRANLQQSRSARAGAAAAAAALLENVKREEVGCPLSRDLGQRKAGGREASLLCVYLKREPFTAVSRLVFIHRTDTEQMRRDTSERARPPARPRVHAGPSVLSAQTLHVWKKKKRGWG